MTEQLQSPESSPDSTQVEKISHENEDTTQHSHKWINKIIEKQECLFNTRIILNIFYFCCSSVFQSCLILCDALDCSTPGFPVFQYLPSLLKFMSIELVMTSNHLILCHPLILLPSIFPSIRVFSTSQLSTSSRQSIGASALVLPMNSQSWFPLGLIDLIFFMSKGLSRVFSCTTVWKHQFLNAQSYLWTNFTSICDYWKNHSFDYTDLCQQSDVYILIHILGLS